MLPTGSARQGTNGKICTRKSTIYVNDIRNIVVNGGHAFKQMASTNTHITTTVEALSAWLCVGFNGMGWSPSLYEQLCGKARVKPNAPEGSQAARLSVMTGLS